MIKGVITIKELDMTSILDKASIDYSLDTSIKIPILSSLTSKQPNGTINLTFEKKYDINDLVELMCKKDEKEDECEKTTITGTLNFIFNFNIRSDGSVNIRFTIRAIV
jgi:hypothetical protein